MKYIIEKYFFIPSHFSSLSVHETWILLGALFSGFCGSFAFAPWFIWVLLMPSFGVLMLLIMTAKNCLIVATRGFIWAIGFFFTSIQWMTVAISLSPDMAWLAWPTIFVFAMGVALLFIVPLVIFVFLCSGLPIFLLCAVFAVFWSISTWLRGFLIHFLWNPVGNIWVVSDMTMQMLSLLGPHGLSLMTVFAATCSGLALWRGVSWQKRLLALWMLPLLGAVLWLHGMWRLPDKSLSTYQKYGGENVEIRLVQAGFNPRVLRSSRENKEHIATLVQFSRRNLPAKTQAVLWPESAWPYLVEENAFPPLGTLLDKEAKDDVFLISGFLLQRENNYYNAMGGFNVQGLQFVYEKVVLVPYGEYIPFRWLIPNWIFSINWGYLTAGSRIPVVHVPGLPPFQPLICYEATFPNFYPEGERPAWLLNITNDAWFGQSAGPHQHLANARMRAVERGIPMIRVANTGTSASIDSYGRLLKTLPLGSVGVLDVRIPSSLPPTPYVRFGEAFWLGICAVILLFSGLTLFRRRISS